MSDHHRTHDSKGVSREGNLRKLRLVCFVTVGYMLVEVVAGFLTGSLALLADAGHMMADVASLLMALLAAWFATKPPTIGKTYGYYRSEILSGFLTALLLIAMAGFLFFESYRRLSEPSEVQSLPMLIVATIGLGVNLFGIKTLHGSSENSLNVKAAYLEVMADLVASIGVIIGGVVMLFTHWYFIDPIISFLIALWILPRTWRLLKECTNILMEGTPGDINMIQLRLAISQIPGVEGIHDIHVWVISTGLYSMSGHLILKDNVDAQDVLKQVSSMIQDNFGITHTTIQVEGAECASRNGHSGICGDTAELEG
ncbi:MAG: cation diffusion facilitator family transporter [Candidatus Obscuribacterales bacterium]|nr:cation diffusion facilitator family transporter [Candidatus Obscuribacterales bacterium]